MIFFHSLVNHQSYSVIVSYRFAEFFVLEKKASFRLNYINLLQIIITNHRYIKNNFTKGIILPLFKNTQPLIKTKLKAEAMKHLFGTWVYYSDKQFKCENFY